MGAVPIQVDWIQNCSRFQRRGWFADRPCRCYCHLPGNAFADKSMTCRYWYCHSGGL